MKMETAENLSKVLFIKHGFFSRHGGLSSGVFESLNVGIGRGDDDEIVAKNRRKIASTFGANHMFLPKQVHGNEVVVLDSVPDTQIECDAIITNLPGVLIGVGTADCVPILLCDTKMGYVAAIHSGWRSAVSGIIENTFEKMHQLGCNNIECATGPCIQQKSYEVSNEVTGSVDPKYIDKNSNFDISKYVIDKLDKCGGKSISSMQIDTHTNMDYFSYRRNGQKECGVQFSGIMIMENI